MASLRLALLAVLVVAVAVAAAAAEDPSASQSSPSPSAASPLDMYLPDDVMAPSHQTADAILDFDADIY